MLLGFGVTYGGGYKLYTILNFYEKNMFSLRNFLCFPDSMTPQQTTHLLETKQRLPRCLKMAKPQIKIVQKRVKVDGMHSYHLCMSFF